MSTGTTHIIGAGLAGLSAATRLAAEGRRVIVHEAAGHAGGRCRSYHDAAFGGIIDNGNHLLLSGNGAALSYLKRIGSSHVFAGPGKPHFDFIDAKTADRWTIRLSRGRIPSWLLDSRRRVPDTKIGDYFSVLRLLRAAPRQTVTSLINPDTLLYRRLWHPLLLSALNTDLHEASARLAGGVLRGSLLKGGNACIPLVAEGLSPTFIDPALRLLAKNDAAVLFNHRLRQIHYADDKAVRLDFTSGDPVALSAGDSVIVATAPWAANSLLPGVRFPDIHRSILNAHFNIAPPAGFPAILGVINATTEWIFAFPDRLSVTISNADHLMQDDRDALARQLWGEVAKATGLASPLPQWQIVKEKRATFAATPQQDAKRPGTETPWRNVYLAGDYVQTGLPATIEGAVLSGERAAASAVRPV